MLRRFLNVDYVANDSGEVVWPGTSNIEIQSILVEIRRNFHCSGQGSDSRKCAVVEQAVCLVIEDPSYKVDVTHHSTIEKSP